MTTDLRPFEIDNLRLTADKVAMRGDRDTSAVLHQLLDSAEDAEESETAHAERIEELDKEIEALSDALKEARGMFERIRSTSETAREGDALERHGEIRLLAEEAIKDIADGLD